MTKNEGSRRREKKYEGRGPEKEKPEKEAEAVALLDEVDEAEEVDGEGSDDDGGGEETETRAEVTVTEIGEEKTGGGAGGKKTEGDGKEEEGRESAAIVVGERRPSWVMGEETGKAGTMEERSGGLVEKKQRREGGEGEVHSCGCFEEEGSIVQAGKEEEMTREKKGAVVDDGGDGRR